MRVYLGPALQQFLSAVTLCLALGTFGWVAWTAINAWTSDPTLEQIQEIREAQ